jgi:hypothetical protein
LQVIALHGSLGSTVAVSPPGVTDAAPVLGWAVGPPANTLLGGSGPFVIPAGSAVQVTATNTSTIALAAADFVDPTRATAREVRRAFNRGFAVAQLPVRALVPKVEIRIRRSQTDVDGAPAAVAADGSRPCRLEPVRCGGRAAALFGLFEMMKQPLVQAAHGNFLYVARQTSARRQSAARHRVFQLAMGAAPIAPAAIGAAVPLAVRRGSASSSCRGTRRGRSRAGSSS